MKTVSTSANRFARVIASAVAAVLILAACIPAFAADAPETARPSVNGALRVSAGRLEDASGRAVQLRGVSTHGLTWFPDYINAGLFGQISEDWDCNLIRLAMYSEFYCGDEKEENLALMKKGDGPRGPKRYVRPCGLAYP